MSGSPISFGSRSNVSSSDFSLSAVYILAKATSTAYGLVSTHKRISPPDLPRIMLWVSKYRLGRLTVSFVSISARRLAAYQLLPSSILDVAQQQEVRSWYLEEDVANNS